MAKFNEVNELPRKAEMIVSNCSLTEVQPINNIQCPTPTGCQLVGCKGAPSGGRATSNGNIIQRLLERLQDECCQYNRGMGVGD